MNVTELEHRVEILELAVRKLVDVVDTMAIVMAGPPIDPAELGEKYYGGSE